MGSRDWGQKAFDRESLRRASEWQLVLLGFLVSFALGETNNTHIHVDAEMIKFSLFLVHFKSQHRCGWWSLKQEGSVLGPARSH